MRYLKPHGALYHRVTDDAGAGDGGAGRVGDLPVLGFPGSRLLELAAAAGRATYGEGFPDRGYAEGRLLDRGEPGALLDDEEAIADQAVELAPDVAPCACTATRPVPSRTRTPYAGRWRPRATGYAVPTRSR